MFDLDSTLTDKNITSTTIDPVMTNVTTTQLTTTTALPPSTGQDIVDFTLIYIGVGIIVLFLIVICFCTYARQKIQRRKRGYLILLDQENGEQEPFLSTHNNSTIEEEDPPSWDSIPPVTNSSVNSSEAHEAFSRNPFDNDYPDVPDPPKHFLTMIGDSINVSVASPSKSDQASQQISTAPSVSVSTPDKSPDDDYPDPPDFTDGNV